MNEKHGYSHTRLYKCWSSMRERCHNHGHKFYNDYGGRGIRICSEWNNSFLPFREWALTNGYQYNLELDRENNDGNYTPENCRWVTRKTNFNNRRGTRRVTAFGETKTIEEWTVDERCKLKYATIWARLRRGWGGQRAITTPLQP